jgi:hypothetical protein
MADKFEREIEEILAKLDDQLPPGPEKGARAPISLSKKRQQKAKAQRPTRPNRLANISATTLMFSGAGLMFAGLIVSTFWGPAIWASFAGVVLFIGAFLLSFRRTQRPPAGGGRTQGTFWRDRYIDDRPQDGGIKGRFRRK